MYTYTTDVVCTCICIIRSDSLAYMWEWIHSCWFNVRSLWLSQLIYVCACVCVRRTVRECVSALTGNIPPTSRESISVSCLFYL